MIEWADRFDARILLHEADRDWVMRKSDRIELWSGERPRVEELELSAGGHYEGGTVCLGAGSDGRGALLSGDIVQVVADRDWVSFMYSYPNLIPLPNPRSSGSAAHRDARVRSRLRRLVGHDRR